MSRLVTNGTNAPVPIYNDDRTDSILLHAGGKANLPQGFNSLPSGVTWDNPEDAPVVEAESAEAPEPNQEDEAVEDEVVAEETEDAPAVEDEVEAVEEETTETLTGESRDNRDYNNRRNNRNR